MGGGLMQLVAYGAQDIYLTGNPQITFFKVVYRRYTNFSMESIQQTWNGFTPTSDGRCTATISRNGDLVYKMYIQIERHTTSASWVGCNPGANWIKNISVEIGGQTIDKQYGSWLETWAELTEPNEIGARAMVNVSASNSAAGDAQASTDFCTTLQTRFQRMTGYGGVAPMVVDPTGIILSRGYQMAAGKHFYVPLQFWFNRNVGLSLPLIALQYHEVNIVLEHQFASVWGAGGTGYGNPTQSLWADYIYLDTDERRRFAQVSHEYLIEQLQMQTSIGNTIDLNFNHPVKELIWTGKWEMSAGSGFNQTLGTANVPGMGASSGTTLYQIKLNGQDRFAARPLTYFTKLQVQQYHTGPGGLNVQSAGTNDDGKLHFAANASYSNQQAFNDSIAVYSFALNPEEHQPSGTCNFSRIDTAQLVRTGAGDANTTYNVYAVNYNVLRIMSGMGGLAYSN